MKPGVRKIKIDKIKIGKRLRAYDKARAQELADSMARVGLLQEIVVDDKLNLVAGRHRLGGAKILGWKDIDARVIPHNVQSRLAEIDENLIRSELTVLEKANHVEEREKILKEIGVLAEAGQSKQARELRQVGELQTTKTLAKDINVSERSYQRLRSIGTISDEAKKVLKGTPIEDNQRKLEAIASAPKKEQVKKAKAAVKGVAQSKKDAVEIKSAGKAVVNAAKEAKKLLTFDLLFMNSIRPLVHFLKTFRAVYAKNKLYNVAGYKFGRVMKNIDFLIEALESWHPDKLKKCANCGGTRKAKDGTGKHLVDCLECAQGMVGEDMKHAARPVSK